MLCGHVACVNYKCCDLIGTPKFLPLDQECCRFSPDPLPRVAMGGVSLAKPDPTARAGGSGVLSIRDFVPLECNALRNTYRNREARH